MFDYELLGKRQRKSFYNILCRRKMAKVQDNDIVLLKKERLQSCAKDIYTNRFSLIYIILGYGIGLFGNIADTDNKLYMFLLIFIFCFILTRIGCYFPSLISKKVYVEDKEVDRKVIENLQMYNGLVKRKSNI